jgi:hypothetical protein
VYSQPAAGAEVVLTYLARYMHRVAISSSRLRAVTAATVMLAYKHYRQGGRRNGRCRVRSSRVTLCSMCYQAASCERVATACWPIAAARPSWWRALACCW